jgi:4-amino-4-deoxy-L-arabinose transferase-like glycosyltransferase
MEEARTWVPRAVALISFAVYAVAAPAGTYWLDSAELSAAAVQMGSPHPTGFPLYCIAAKAASLIPFGELAFRINLVSAACAALAVLWVTRLVCESCRDDIPGLVGGVAAGLTLAASLTFFRQATVAEVYAPTAALIAGALVLYLRVSRGAGPREGLALAVVAGLGLTVHTSFLLLGPVLFVLYMVRLRRGARWTLVAPLLVVVVAGATYSCPCARRPDEPRRSIGTIRATRAAWSSMCRPGASATPTRSRCGRPTRRSYSRTRRCSAATRPITWGR